MKTVKAILGIATVVALQALVLPTSAEARYGRGAAFVGGAAVGGAVARNRSNNYYYGAPAYVAPAPGYRCY